MIILKLASVSLNLMTYIYTANNQPINLTSNHDLTVKHTQMCVLVVSQHVAKKRPELCNKSVSQKRCHYFTLMYRVFFSLMGKIFQNFCSQEGCSTEQYVAGDLCLLPLYPETQLPPCCHPKPKCRSVLFTIWYQMFSFYELPRPQRINPTLFAHALSFPFIPMIPGQLLHGLP